MIAGKGETTIQVGLEEHPEKVYTFQLMRYKPSVFPNLTPIMSGEATYGNWLFRYIIVQEEELPFSENVVFLTFAEFEVITDKLRRAELNLLLDILLKLSTHI